MTPEEYDKLSNYDKIVITAKLEDLNKFIKISKNINGRAAVKRINDNTCLAFIKNQCKYHYDKVKLHYVWYEPKKNRDGDNVAFGAKFIQDAMVKAGVLDNDNLNNIVGFTHDFRYGKEYAVEIFIEERSEDKWKF